MILFPHFLISIRSSPPPSHPTPYSFFLSLKRKPQRETKNQNRQKDKKISKQNNSYYIQTHKHACFLPFNLCPYVCMYVCTYICVCVNICTYMHIWLYILVNVLARIQRKQQTFLYLFLNILLEVFILKHLTKESKL